MNPKSIIGAAKKKSGIKGGSVVSISVEKVKPTADMGMFGGAMPHGDMSHGGMEPGMGEDAGGPPPKGGIQDRLARIEDMVSEIYAALCGGGEQGDGPGEAQDAA